MSTSTDPLELPEEEVAGQAGRRTPAEKAHPFEEGRLAAEQNFRRDSCPYKRADWRRAPWLAGWNKNVADAGLKASMPAEPVTAEPEEPQMATPKTHRAPKRGVQEELIPDSRVIGKSGDHVIDLPDEIKAILAQTDDAIYYAALYKGQENEFKAQMVSLMAQHGVNEITLPRGGKLLYKPGKPSAQYVAPKEAAKKGEADGGEEGMGEDHLGE